MRAWLLALELLEDEDDEVGLMTNDRLVGFCSWHNTNLCGQHRCDAMLLVHER